VQADQPVVSVIVPVRDNSDGVAHLLAALERQTIGRDRLEVLVGDDGSAVSLGDLGDSVQVLRGPRRTSYAARNRAAAHARADRLAFCDSDCLPDPDWLEQGLALLERADVAAGEVVFDVPERPTVWSLLTIDMFLDQRRSVALSQAVTANLLVRRAHFERLGGFDESLPSGGDLDFAARSVAGGARLAYAPRAIVRHPTLDCGRRFLCKVWNTNRWAAARRAREGRLPSIAGGLAFVPLVGVALARRRALRPIARLYRPRLEACGVTASRSNELRALLVLYLVVAYVAGLAQLRGWIHGRRLARNRNAGR
jgi:glycosyltransferase involved in cell wall biosynthesis